jgi:hypothetical protein
VIWINQLLNSFEKSCAMMRSMRRGPRKPISNI